MATSPSPVPLPAGRGSERSEPGEGRRATRSSTTSSASGSRRSPGGGSTISRPTGAASGRCGSSWRCSWSACSPSWFANDRPILVFYDGAFYCRS